MKKLLVLVLIVLLGLSSMAYAQNLGTINRMGRSMRPW